LALAARLAICFIIFGFLDEESLAIGCIIFGTVLGFVLGKTTSKGGSRWELGIERWLERVDPVAFAYLQVNLVLAGIGLDRHAFPFVPATVGANVFVYWEMVFLGVRIRASGLVICATSTDIACAAHVALTLAITAGQLVDHGVGVVARHFVPYCGGLWLNQFLHINGL